MARLLAENRANANWKDKDGATLLMHAAAFGRTEIIKLLLKKGATVKAHDNEGHAALHYAKTRGHADTVTILEEAMAKQITRNRSREERP